MQVKVAILVENTTPVPGLLGEYGFSALVEVEGEKYLFDTGSGAAIFSNAKTLGVDWSTITALILSHGHFDHTGGVLEILQKIKQPLLYAHPGIFTRHLVPSGSDQHMYIGASFTQEELADIDAKFIAVQDFMQIADDIYVTGAVPRITEYEGPGGPFVKDISGEIIPDPIEDDMAMVINHPQGLIIISGCAHSGMINMINYAIQSCERREILAFIGGTHLISADEERLQKTVTALKNINPQHLIISHCTGFTATSRLIKEFPSLAIKGETGMVFQF